MSELYIGLMSGTSMDGVDAALVSFAQRKPHLIHAINYPWPDDLVARMLQLATGELVAVDEFASIDALAGKFFAEAALQVISSQASAEEICAIGSHGQTLAHNPDAEVGYSLQIGNPNIIAEFTQITTVADFRGRDIAAKGQGAPLVPAFHQAVFQCPGENRVILNIGGIANLTWLPADGVAHVEGFDTGPGNCLMDAWVRRYIDQQYDQDGNYARQGKMHPELLAKLLCDPYFDVLPPKSTGTDYFSLAWLEKNIADQVFRPEDVQATLLHLTAQSIVQAIKQHYPKVDRVLICGGGCHNAFLVQILTDLLPCPLETTEFYGVAPDWVEAIAFAWLAREHIKGRSGNIVDVTGAKGNRVLGALYPV